MAKAYWICCYHQILDQNKLTSYAKLAGPAIIAHGGQFLARGEAALAYEAGIAGRTVLIEFPDLAAAQEAHDSAAYQEALVALDGGAIRDLRLVEGLPPA